MDQLELYAGSRHQRRLQKSHRRNPRLRRGCGADRAACADPDRGIQKRGVAATVKHWPGEGFDDRDQHLVTTINPLSREAWEASFGRLYRAAIKAGVMSVMSAHIAFPAYIRSLDPAAKEAAYVPASVSADLNIRLLRGELGFNGLIVSDATVMAGLTAFMETGASKAEVIRQGCDIILFSDEPEGDHARVKAEIEAGTLPIERVKDAVSRTLGFKAALGLHRRKPTDSAARKAVLRSSESRRKAAAVTMRAPTLVKDTKGLFPISKEKHRRVMIVSGGIVSPLHPEPFRFALPDMLRAEGFEVTEFLPGTQIDPAGIDLMLYLLGEETLLTRGRIFLDWAKVTAILARRCAGIGTGCRPPSSASATLTTFMTPRACRLSSMPTRRWRACSPPCSPACSDAYRLRAQARSIPFAGWRMPGSSLLHSGACPAPCGQGYSAAKR